MTRTVLGIVGGSGLYEIPGLKDVHWEDVRSPWGSPSDQILFAELDGLPIRFLPRHGRGHKIPPSAINFRANIDALKRAGVTDVVSVSACGSLKEEPATRAFRDRRPVHRPHLRAREELLRHRLRRPRVDGRSGLPGAGRPSSRRRPRTQKIPYTRGGTYLVMEGPQFSTPRRKQPLPQLGLRRDRHDQHARGQARARGRDLLRDRGHGDRLRLLARRARRRRRRRRHQGAARATSTRRTA